jgi:DNA modification methylase
MMDIIKIHTNPGDLIIDPFMGSGTTGVACKKLKRSYIGIELSKEYFAIAKERISEIQ